MHRLRLNPIPPAPRNRGAKSFRAAARRLRPSSPIVSCVLGSLELVGGLDGKELAVRQISAGISAGGDRFP